MKDNDERKVRATLLAYLDDEKPDLLDPEVACNLLALVAEDEALSRRLAEQERHAELLLEASRQIRDEAAAADPGTRLADDSVAADQEFVVMFAKEVFERLAGSPAGGKIASSRLPEDYHDQLWAVDESTLDPGVLRTAVAVSECALAIQSHLSVDTTRGRLGEARLKVGQREVPSDYFVGRIAQRSGLDDASARVLWTAIADTLVKGRMGLPGLRWVDGTESDAVLECDFEDSKTGSDFIKADVVPERVVARLSGEAQDATAEDRKEHEAEI